MSKSKTGSMVKRIVDAVMSVLLLVLMAYQVTGEAAHEWIGMCMTVLVIIHQILNRKWYSALFKGKYNPYRTFSTVINVLLILSFALTAFSGMSMSGHAVPFLYGMAPISFARRTHLSMSHWSFVLMGLHLGMHIPAMMSGMKRQDKTSFIPACLFTVLGGIGLWLFLRNGIPDYLFFRVPFAFLDYDKAGWLVLLENLLMLSFWAFIGTQTANLLRNAARTVQASGNAVQGAGSGKESRTAAPGKNPLLPVVFMMAAVIIGIVLRLAIPSGEDDMSFGGADWSTPQTESTVQAEGASQAESTLQAEEAPQADYAQLQSGGFLVRSADKSKSGLVAAWLKENGISN